MRYNTYAESLKKEYGEKVYKIPVNLPVTCPNRDGTLGFKGCTFCGEVATGFESLDNQLSVREQLEKNIAYISKKYKAEKFIAYFQNFTNTYMPLDLFEKRMQEACLEGVVEICVSTRPDCLGEAYLDVLKSTSDRYGVNISIELGLQSINPTTLKKINRGHGVAAFIDSALRTKAHGFKLCAHLIANLPWDSKEVFLEAGRVLSVLKVDYVKIHSLYILKGTSMGDAYEAGEFSIISPEDYVDRVVSFIEVVSPDMVFQRLAARAPEELTLFCNWGMSWWKLKDMIDEALESRDISQGALYEGVIVHSIIE
ncbi:MAG: TIGR01212 family radical SAM protein [Clostridia bacterium]|nr:TIGR01212 family radical SAM protein [Clostridia bacterium]